MMCLFFFFFFILQQLQTGTFRFETLTAQNNETINSRRHFETGRTLYQGKFSSQ